MVLGTRTGPGYIIVYVKPNMGPVNITGFLIYSLNGSLLCVGSYPLPIVARYGTITAVPIMPLFMNCNVTSLPDYGIIVFTTSLNAVVESPYMTYNLDPLKDPSKYIKIVFFDDRYPKGRHSNLDAKLKVDPYNDEWDLVIFSINGLAEIIRHYGHSGKSFKTFHVTLRILHSTSRLDIHDMTPDERYNLGPIVIVFNPTYGLKDWTFTIIDKYGNKHTYILKKISNKYVVSLDFIIMWEDQWKPDDPGVKYQVDDWRDSMIRATIFTNGTIRIEPFEEKGDYLHAFFYNPDTLDPWELIDAVVSREPIHGLIYIKPSYIYHQVYDVKTHKLVSIGEGKYVWYIS